MSPEELAPRLNGNFDTRRRPWVTPEKSQSAFRCDERRQDGYDQEPHSHHRRFSGVIELDVSPAVDQEEARGHEIQLEREDEKPGRRLHGAVRGVSIMSEIWILR